MNKWAGLGRITRDLELRYSQNNSMAILKFSIAVNRRKKDEVDFINCIAFDKTAENIAKFFEKGSQIGIIGHIQTGSYKDKDDRTVYTTDIVVDEWDFCGSKSTKNEADDSGFECVDPISDDEIPF